MCIVQPTGGHNSERMLFGDCSELMEPTHATAGSLTRLARATGLLAPCEASRTAQIHRSSKVIGGCMCTLPLKRLTLHTCSRGLRTGQRSVSTAPMVCLVGELGTSWERGAWHFLPMRLCLRPPATGANLAAGACGRLLGPPLITQKKSKAY